MKLSEAIKIQAFERKATLPPRKDKFWAAVQLGEEAMKRLQVIRGYPHTQWLAQLLPGETEE